MPAPAIVVTKPASIRSVFAVSPSWRTEARFAATLGFAGTGLSGPRGSGPVTTGSGPVTAPSCETASASAGVAA